MRQQKITRIKAICAAWLTLSLIIAGATVKAQTLSGVGCTGNVLTVSSSSTPLQITWKRDGIVTGTMALLYATNGITVAGTGSSGSDATQLSYPYGIAMDGSGNMYIADHENHRVQKWAPGATEGITVAGTGEYGSGADQLTMPDGVFVDAAGNLYVADQNNHRVQKWAPGATEGVTVAGITGSAGTGAAQLSSPYGVFVDVAGNLYVSDKNNHRVQKWAPGATEGITVAGNSTAGNGAGQLQYPCGLYVDGAGNIYIADLNNGRIQKWAPGATEGITVAGMGGMGSGADQLLGPSDVYVDAGGYIYVADGYNNRIQRWAPGSTSGTTAGAIGGWGSGPLNLNQPTGIAFDNAGNIYTTDFYNSRVQKFTASIINTLTATTAGDYSAVVTTATGNATTNTVTVNASPNPGVINGPGFVCTGNEITLTDAETTGTWSASNGNATVTGGLVHGVASGTVIISYIDATPTCGTASTTRLIAVYNTPALYTASPCTGNALSVTGDNPPVQIKWQRDGVVVGTNDRTYAHDALTIAGTGTSGSGASQVSYPYGLAVDGSGNVYIADHENFRVQKWAPGATAGTTVAGTGVYGSSASQLTKPEGIYVDAAGNIYVADAFNHRIQKWAPGATSGVTVAGVTGVSGTAANLLSSPYGVFADAAGNVYVCDQNNHRVQKWAPGATSGTTVAGNGTNGNGADQLSYPAGLCVDGSGNIYVADLNNARIQKWAPGATSGTTVAGTGSAGSGNNELFGPADVYVDAAGNLIIADEYNNRIQKWVPGATSGTTIASVGGYGVGPSQTAHPTGLAFDNSGNLYTTDYYNNRIQKYIASITTTYNPSVAGDYSAAVAVFTGNITTNVVTVNASPNPGQILGHTAVFAGHDMTLTDEVTTGTWSTSNSNATVTGGVVHGVTAGTVLVSYTDVSVFCGSASATKTMTVYNVPILSIPTPCAGNILSLTSDLQPQQINWRRDGVVTATSNLTYAADAVTVAGTGYEGTDATQLKYPLGITLDAGGNVYVADYENNRIQKWAPGATSGTTVAGTGVYGSGPDQLARPEGVFVDASGTMYIADAFNQRIQKWAAGATSGVTIAGITGVQGSNANQFAYPRDISVDAVGNVYVSDVNNHRIQKWAPGATSGVTVAGTGIGGNGADQLYYPAGIYVDEPGNLYVADAGNARVQKWAPGATSGVTVAGTGSPGSGDDQLNGVMDLVIDEAGNLLIADGYNNRIQKWAPGASSGVTIAGLGGYGPGASQLNQPNGIALDNSGGLYTSDYYNHRVQKFTASIVTTYNVTASGNYTAVINSVAGSVTTEVLTVLPTPSAGPITGTSVVCAGGATTVLTDAAAGGAWNSTASGIASVGSTGTVTGVSGGTTTISHTVTNVCGSSTATTVVTVNPLPNAGSITGPSTVAVGTDITLTDAAAGGVWSASNSRATVSAGIVHGVSAGTVTISYSVVNGCGTATATKLVTVGTVTTVAPITGYYFYMCMGATAVFNDATPGGTWSIDATDAIVASVSPTGVVTGMSPGTARLSYTFGASSATAVVTVYPTPTPITGSPIVCLGTTSALTDMTPGGVWSSGIPSTASITSAGIVTGINPGTTPVYYTLVAPAGCKASIMVSVNAGPASITGPTSVCTGASASLHDATPGGYWSSTSTNVSVTGTGSVTGLSVGTATVTYMAAGCYKTYNVTVNTTNAGTISGASSVVAGATIALSNTVGGGVWSAGNANATVSPTGVVAGISAGTVTISYTVSGSCGSTSATYLVSVTASTTPGITGNLSICNGLTSALTDAVLGGTWRSSNILIATVGTSGLVTASATNTGTTTISYTLSGVVTTAVVTVNPNPSSIIGASSVCLGTSITMTDFTAGGVWSSTGGISVTTGTTTTTVTGLSSGTNTVTYMLATGCYKTFPVTVRAIPAAISGNLSVCGVGAVTFLSDVTAGTSWTISPVSTATVSASGRVYGVSPGTATVTYTSTNTCITTAIVTVNALVTVPPIMGATNVSHGATIALSDVMAGGMWSSSNPSLGSVDGVGNVTGVGTAGVVTISYAVSYAGGGCTAYATKGITVHTPAPPHHSTTTTGVGNIISLAAETTANGLWESSDSSIATVDENGVITAIAAGTVTITHTSTNSDGEISVTHTHVTINELPIQASIFPNPNNGAFTVKGTLGTNKDAEVYFEITNMLGQVVCSSKATATGGIINEQIQLNSALANGMYLLNIHSGNESKVFHLVMEK